MNCIKKTVFVLFVFLSFSAALSAQKTTAVTDSLLKLYKTERKLERKAELAGELSMYYMAIDTTESDKWGSMALEHAEISRDRKAMIQANIANGLRYSFVMARKEYGLKAIVFLQKALDIAKENKLEKEEAISLLWLSLVHRQLPDAEKALNYATQAFAVTQSLVNDSLLSASYLAFAKCYRLKQDKLPALKNIFEATVLAEKINDISLMRDCYLSLSDFYRAIKNYDKALDYAFKILELDKKSTKEESKYARVTNMNTIAGIYVEKKNYDMAQKFYEQSISYADTLRFAQMKMQGYIGLLNMYLSTEPSKALTFFNNNPELKAGIAQYGMGSVIDQAYGVIYSELNQFDSAKYYFARAFPFFENKAGATGKISFYQQYADYLLKTGNAKASVATLEKANAMAAQIGSLNWMQLLSKNLDSACQKAGDYKQALYYSKLSRQYKDSLDKLGKEDEILQLQINDEEKRRERLAAAEKEKIEKRNRIQYMAIIIAIAAVFVGLVMLGFLRVSASTIRIIGFFAFLMFFEFIFLVFKKSIYGITHGEPWKDLGMMILIAALLVPLHHWVEHKVIHYLSSQHMLRFRSSSKAWWRGLFKKEKQSAEHH
jgi:tetratricopeptide (TPR) repeat protein